MKKILLVLCALFISVQQESSAFNFKNVTDAAASAALQQVQQQVQQQNTAVKKQADNTASSLASKISGLNSRLEKADSSMQNSFLSLVSILSPEQEAKSIETQVSSLMTDNSKNQPEKSALLSQIISEYASELKADKASAAKTISNLQSEEKTMLAETLSSLTKSGSEYTALAKNYAALTTAASSAAELSKNLTVIKEAVSAVKSSAGAAASLVSAVSKLTK